MWHAMVEMKIHLNVPHSLEESNFKLFLLQTDVFFYMCSLDFINKMWIVK